MSTYSISDLEQLSGIKAHTIRMWERRYRIIEPRRTPTNIRYYSDEELKKLLNVALLVQHGFKISLVSQMQPDDLNREVMALCRLNDSLEVHMDQLLSAMLAFDGRAFLSHLNGVIDHRGFEAMVESLLFPFLQRVDLLWQTGAIVSAHEQFVSNLVRQKMCEVIGGVPSLHLPNTARIVFFLTPGHESELQLLFYSLLARKSGLEVIYLGHAVSVDDLRRLHQTRPVDVFFTCFSKMMEPDDIAGLITPFEGEFQGMFWVAGDKVPDVLVFDRIQYRHITSGSSFRMVLSDLMLNMEF
ncbi:MerR family transcriptional regulator [Breznakibacter xylanolyticus]|nr:MerR family transcriptional regulator [Breznakibacter xylanolyticus]MBN2743627.1 MerR family transcriptional regulator [Marinilabiliaceae bacterium]